MYGKWHNEVRIILYIYIDYMKALRQLLDVHKIQFSDRVMDYMGNGFFFEIKK